MFLIKRMFSKAVTQEYLISKMNEVVKGYAKPPYKFEVPYQQLGINEMEMVEITCLFQFTTGIWLDCDKVMTLNTLDELIKLALETAEKNPPDDHATQKNSSSKN